MIDVIYRQNLDRCAEPVGVMSTYFTNLTNVDIDVPVDDDDFDIWVADGKETLNLFASKVQMSILCTLLCPFVLILVWDFCVKSNYYPVENIIFLSLHTQCLW